MNKATKWRKRHPRCRYCKHVHVILSPIGGEEIFYECRAKDALVNGDIPRIFCGVFEPTEYEQEDHV